MSSPYIPRVYQPDSSLQDMILRAAELRAAGQRQNGAIWGGALRDLGHIAGDAINQHAEIKAGEKAAKAKAIADQPRLQDEAKLRALNIQKGERDIAEEDKEAQRTAWFESKLQSGEMPKPAEVMAVMGEKRGFDVIKGIGLLQPDGAARYSDQAKVLRDAARAVKALPAAAQPAAWSVMRSSLLSQRAVDESMIPEGFDQNLLDQAAAFGQEPQVQKQETRGIDVQAADALARGDKVTYDRLVRVKKEMGQADDRPLQDSLVKVEHKDPQTGQTVIEYLPKSEIKGQKFEKGLGVTESNRANAAASVNAVGDNIVRKLSDPKYAAVVGPALGRYNSIQEFIGNPPPELSELAGEIESYSLANMGVHGMRSAQGAKEIAKLLSAKHTPASLIAAIKGLQTFSDQYLKTVGRAPAKASTPESAPEPVKPKGKIIQLPDGTYARK